MERRRAVREDRGASAGTIIAAATTYASAHETDASLSFSRSILMSLIVAIAVAMILNLLILLVLQKRYDPVLYRVVALTYLGTVLLRYALATYMWLNHADGHFSLALWGDSETYDVFGAAVADSWSHGTSTTSWTSTVEGKVNRGFIYFVAFVYYLFGRNVILVQFLNGIIGALTPIAILELGLLLYNRRVATTAMLLTAFFPQMIFWSAALYMTRR
jgi:hypothetical protein